MLKDSNIFVTAILKRVKMTTKLKLQNAGFIIILNLINVFKVMYYTIHVHFENFEF